MPPRIDDLGVGQDQLDERHEQPVVGQLVDEERPVGPPLHRRALQIFLAELAPLVRRSARARLPDSARSCARAPGMSGSSDVPSTRLCEDRICSTRVDPARGIPTMKIGSGASQPPERSAKASAVNSFDAAVDELGVMSPGLIRLDLQAKRVGRSNNARTPRRPGRHRASPCPARNRDGSGPRRSEPGRVERLLHRGNVGFVELDRLQVGEAPPGFAQASARCRSPCDRRRCPRPAARPS